MPRLDEWRKHTHPLGATLLSGKVSQHPKHPDGTQITTKKIVEFVGERFARCKDGLVYELGRAAA